MIRNLLFDLGGVIMDIRRDDCVKAFEALGMRDVDSLLGEYSQQGPFLKIEDGSFTPAQWRGALRPYLRPDVTDAEIDNAFMAFLTGIPVSRLRQLEQLGTDYEIYLLSNTNPVMWNAKIADEFRKDGYDISHYFKGTVTSFEAKAVKPAPEIFNYAVGKFGIDPSETLFLDDSAVNIEEARKLGFHGAVVEPGAEFYQIVGSFR